jgi:hypothetical protein
MLLIALHYHLMFVRDKHTACGTETPGNRPFKIAKILFVGFLTRILKLKRLDHTVLQIHEPERTIRVWL